jgi:hypothetical protein
MYPSTDEPRDGGGLVIDPHIREPQHLEPSRRQLVVAFAGMLSNRQSVELRLTYGPSHKLWRGRAAKVSDGSSGSGDCDAVAPGCVRVGQAAGAVQVDSGPLAAPTYPRNGYVYRAVGWFEQAPQLHGAPVTQRGALTARQHRRHPPPLTAPPRMSYRIHPTEDSKQASGRDPARDAALVDSGGDELRMRDDPVLSGSDMSHNRVDTVDFFSHTENRSPTVEFGPRPPIGSARGRG